MKPIWVPLEHRLGRDRCAGFMFMGRVNGINLYKHGITRSYLNLDDDGNCYVYRGNWQYEGADFSVELEKLEASLKQQGETLESVYDDEYIARKTEALHKAGIPLLRIKVEPEGVKVH
ncbi:MAG: hypothetical protein ACYDA9_20325 [Terriglobia bacterium]